MRCAAFLRRHAVKPKKNYSGYPYTLSGDLWAESLQNYCKVCGVLPTAHFIRPEMNYATHPHRIRRNHQLHAHRRRRYRKICVVFRAVRFKTPTGLLNSPRSLRCYSQLSGHLRKRYDKIRDIFRWRILKSGGEIIQFTHMPLGTSLGLAFLPLL